MQWSPRSATDFLVVGDHFTNLYRCKITPSDKEDAPANALAYESLGDPGTTACTVVRDQFNEPLGGHPGPAFVCCCFAPFVRLVVCF